MTKRHRATAEFYATLASIRGESGAAGTSTEFPRLLPRFARILALSAPASAHPVRKAAKTALLAALSHVRRDTAIVLRALLRDGMAAIPAPLRTGSPGWRLTDGHVHEVWEPRASMSTDKQLVIRGLAPLIELITLPRFPFGLCPLCDKVFVRVLGQKYCSPVCMQRGVAAGRREERRPYMRAYMKRYRAAQGARRKEK